MSMEEIKKNINNLEALDKETLISYVYELSMGKKRSENKIVSLKTQLKFYERHMKKLNEMINNALKHNNDEITWDGVEN